MKTAAENSYTTRHVFAAGDPVPTWVNRVVPSRCQPLLVFHQDCLVIARYPEAHVDVYPTVAAAFQSDFRVGPLFYFRPSPDAPQTIRIRGAKGTTHINQHTAPGEPWAPGAITFYSAEAG